MTLRCYSRFVPSSQRARQPRGPRPDGQLDTEALAQQLRDRRGRSQLSVRQAARDAEVSFMTFSRVEAGSQPDLATFLKLCAWLHVPPEQFFVRGAHRDLDTVEAVARHLVSDPALDRDAAERIAHVVRDMYTALARKQAPAAAVACHLRAATILRPGVPGRLAALVDDMHARLEELAASGEL